MKDQTKKIVTVADILLLTIFLFVTCGDVGAAEVAYARGSPSRLLAVCFAKPDDSDSPAE